MPELPDLNAFARNLGKKLRGKKLSRLLVRNKRKLKTPVSKLKKSLEGASIKKISRKGKELHFEFSNGNILSLHLMLHGKLHLFKEKNEEKYTIIELHFDDGSGLALTDFQSSATPSLNPPESKAPDALSKEASQNYLKNQLSKKKTNIKNFLLDQKVIRGIGNAYADEILWKTRISPFSAANKIPPNKINALVKAIPSVLKEAEKQILKEDPQIISGEIRDFLKIHNAKKKKSPTGKEIRHGTLNSRKTYYTDEQVEYK